MTKTIGYVVMWVVILGLVIGGATYLVTAGNKPSELDTFAACLEEKGTKFYGAFWCPHCQDQKKLFGKAAKKLPYVECSTPDGNDVQEVCKTAGIEKYPTWVFPNGSKIEGEQTLEQLAEKTGCVLPIPTGQ